jgi:pimeloyl-ACP methyl ester carboxylesterase
MRKYWIIGGGALAAILVVLIALWASARKPDIPYATLEKRYANAQSHYVDLPGGFHVHYRDQGNAKGPTVLLVHGFFVSLDVWEPWVKRLGNDYRLISVDLPGHGLTRAPQGFKPTMGAMTAFLDAFAKAEHLDRFTLAGFSMGGDIAWRYALAHPERLKGLVLVDAMGWPDPRPRSKSATASLEKMRNPFVRFLFKDYDQSVQVRAKMKLSYADPNLATDAMIERYLELSRAPGHRDILLDLALDFDHHGYATRDKLSAITAPTLVLQGGRDQLVPPASAAKFAAAIPGSRLIVYPDAGHTVPEEAADASAKDLAAFLASLEPKKTAGARPAAAAGAVRHDPNTTVFY